MDKYYAQYLLNKTKDDYNRIAVKFSNTRQHLSEDISYLGKFSQARDRVLDFGCGNGRLSELFIGKKIQYTGVDFSDEMMNLAKEKYPDDKFVLVDNLKLPFKDASFDIIYCLSALHHIPSQELRQALLGEFRRVLKPGGTLVLTVWNLICEPKVKYIIFKNSLLKIFGLTKLDFGDFFRSFSDEKQAVQRYFHCFAGRELKKIVDRAGFSVIERTTLYRGKSKRFSNLLIIAKK
jgi:ubiquinone/menaquinone biosynthesis C-methylase UbiE